MAGERDVLAEAQAFLDEARVLVEPSPEYDDWLVRAPAVIRSLFAATFSALATLSKSAPDRPGCHDPEHPGGAWCANTTGLDRCHDPAANRAPSPEPLPREALDVERLAREAYADRPPLGKRPVPWTPVLRREWTAWARRMATALSPDRPTPP